MRTAGSLLLLVLLHGCACWRVVLPSCEHGHACTSASRSGSGDGRRCRVRRSRTLAPVASRRASRLLLSLELDMDDFDDDEDGVDMNALSDDEVEDLLFNFDDSGLAKPWALKPHLRTMLEVLEEGNAALVDVRPPQAWAKGHLEIAISCPLETLRDSSDLPVEMKPLSNAAAVYVLSGGLGYETEVDAAAELLRDAGFSRAMPLQESYEMLRNVLRGQCKVDVKE